MIPKERLIEIMVLSPPIGSAPSRELHNYLRACEITHRDLAGSGFAWVDLLPVLPVENMDVLVPDTLSIYRKSTGLPQGWLIRQKAEMHRAMH